MPGTSMPVGGLSGKKPSAVVGHLDECKIVMQSARKVGWASQH